MSVVGDEAFDKRIVKQERFVDYVIFGTPIVVLAGLWTIFELSDLVTPLMLSAYKLECNFGAKTCSTQVSRFLPFLIVFLAYLVMAGFGYSIKMKTKNGGLKAVAHEVAGLREALGSHEARALKARAEVRGMASATDQIVNSLYSLDKARWRFTKVVGRYAIAADGSAQVEMLYDIEAGPEPAHVWRFSINADDSAQSIDWLDEIDLKVESLDAMDGKGVQYLPFRISPKSKKIAIFFLPEIRPGDSRKLKISYNWPRLAGDLLSSANQTVFDHSFRTCDPADCADVSYTYLFAASIGRLQIQQQSIHVPGDNIKALAHPPDQMFGWAYTNPRLPMDGRKIAFAITRSEPG